MSSLHTDTIRGTSFCVASDSGVGFGAAVGPSGIRRAARRKPECISAAAERASARRAASCGHSPGVSSGQVFADRQRVPDRHVSILQHRHQAGRRMHADRRLETPFSSRSSTTVSLNGSPRA
jgi:hypothetical protein